MNPANPDSASYSGTQGTSSDDPCPTTQISTNSHVSFSRRSCIYDEFIDQHFTKLARRIQEELRMHEMEEIAWEAERAAEAGKERFVGSATTFGFGIDYEHTQRRMQEEENMRRKSIRSSSHGTSISPRKDLDSSTCFNETRCDSVPVALHHRHDFDTNDTLEKDHPMIRLDCSDTIPHVAATPSPNIEKKRLLSSDRAFAVSHETAAYSLNDLTPSHFIKVAISSVHPLISSPFKNSSRHLLPKIRVMALRNIEEVVPNFLEMHDHLRTHMVDSGVIFNEERTTINTSTTSNVVTVQTEGSILTKLWSNIIPSLISNRESQEQGNTHNHKNEIQEEQSLPLETNYESSTTTNNIMLDAPLHATECNKDYVHEKAGESTDESHVKQPSHDVSDTQAPGIQYSGDLSQQNSVSFHLQNHQNDSTWIVLPKLDATVSTASDDLSTSDNSAMKKLDEFIITLNSAPSFSKGFTRRPGKKGSTYYREEIAFLENYFYTFVIKEDYAPEGEHNIGLCGHDPCQDFKQFAGCAELSVAMMDSAMQFFTDGARDQNQIPSQERRHSFTGIQRPCGLVKVGGNSFRFPLLRLHKDETLGDYANFGESDQVRFPSASFRYNDGMTSMVTIPSNVSDDNIEIEITSDRMKHRELVRDLNRSMISISDEDEESQP